MNFDPKYASFEQTLNMTLNIIKTCNIKHGITIETNNKVAVFGDIHGDIDTLKKAYDIAKENEVSHIILLGDYIDKGKDSLGCFKFVLDHFNEDPTHFIPLAGNHETLFFGDLYTELHTKCSKLIPLCWDVICSLPIACLIVSNGKRIYCAHGGYPRLYRPKRIHIHDEYEDIWKLIEPNQRHPTDTNELIYETNNTFNLSPIDYINKVYDDYERCSKLFSESPYNIALYSGTVDKLKEIRKMNDDEQRQTIIKSFKDEPFKKYVDLFLSKLNDYKAQVADVERSKQNAILLKDYIQESDAYVSEENTDNINSYEEFIAFVDKCKTQFFKHERREVKHHNLICPMNEVKQWMKDNNINAFIRGHELCLGCCGVIDLNTDHEEHSPPKEVIFNSSSMLYIAVHTTGSYLALHETYTPKIAIINNDKIEIVTV